MLALGIARAFTFNRAKITAFFKTIDKMFTTHDIIRN